MEGLQKLIGQIGIFMICAQAIMHFRPKEAYGKYLRLLLGVMVLIQIFQPFCSFIAGENGVELTGSLRQFQENMDKSMEEAAQQALTAETMLEEMSMEKVQENLKVQGNPQALEKAEAPEKGQDAELATEQEVRNTADANIKVAPIQIELGDSGEVLP